MNCYDICRIYDSQTCLNLFRFNMIQIATIHMILKHVYTCSDSIWYELLRFIWFSNMLRRVLRCIMKYSKIWGNGTCTKCFLIQSDFLDHFEQVEQSKSIAKRSDSFYFTRKPPSFWNASKKWNVSYLRALNFCKRICAFRVVNPCGRWIRIFSLDSIIIQDKIQLV